MTLKYLPSSLQGAGPKRRAARTAGNQSALSYNAAAGIAGYTGYCPSEQCVPPTIKTAVTARSPQPRQLQNEEAVEQQLALECGPTNSTMYELQYRDPSRHIDFSVDPRSEGAWRQRDAERSAGTLQPKPFLGQSTYQSEILHRGQAQKARTAPDSPSLSGLAPMSIKPGFLTTKQWEALPVHEAAAAAAAAAAASNAANSQPASPASLGSLSCGGPAARGLPTAASQLAQGSLAGACTVLSRFDGITTHKHSYGGMCLTDELNSGTAKQSHQVPGFAGHVPATLELAAAAGRAPHLPREQVELYHLDQHSHGRLPGYTGYKPRAGASLELPPPCRETTQGQAAQLAARLALPPGADTAQGTARPQSYGIKSSVPAFFSSGGGAGQPSQNGLQEAERFHSTVRPLEGRMRVPQASRTARHGAKFSG